jgi:hypothetical protein
VARVKHQEVHQVLARHGVDVAHSQVDAHQLELIASAHGWHWSVEPLGRRQGSTRYQAMVWSPTQTSSGVVSTRSFRGRGATETAALALAVGGMLAHQERIAPPPPLL